MELLPANLNIADYQKIQDTINSILKETGLNFFKSNNITLGKLVLLMSYLLFPDMDNEKKIFGIYEIYINVLYKLNIHPTEHILTKPWQWRIDNYIIELLIQQLLITDQQIGRIINKHNKTKWIEVKKAMLYLQLFNIILKHNNPEKLVYLEKLILSKYK